MSKYWSNEDDGKVSYTSDPSVYQYRPGSGASGQNAADESARSGQDSSARTGRANRAEQPAGPSQNAPRYGGDRSRFIAEEMNAPKKPGEMQFAPPPKFSERYGEAQRPARQETFSYGDGYQVRSEKSEYPGGGRRRGRGWLVLLIVLLVLALIGGGAYVFRHEILNLIGNLFGEEIMWMISPTPAPTEEPADIPAYVQSTAQQAKTKAMQEVQKVTQGVELDTDMVCDQNIVLRGENLDGTNDYYLFNAETGRLLGYYERLQDFVLCANGIFYMEESSYLINSQGYPLADMEEMERIAGSAVTISPMISDWAMIESHQGTMVNFIGTDGTLLSDLWFSKTFPFTAETTMGYVDTGNVTDTQTRYALYLLYQNGKTKRLDYVATTDDMLECVCGMAFMQNGDMCKQDEDLTLVFHTDAAAAYVNCGALAVRDPDTQLYGLFVDGVQQYPFSFDSIEPMPSDLQWTAYENGYVRRYTVTGENYPLPRSYSFVLTSGETQQIVSIASTSEYPILYD